MCPSIPAASTLLAASRQHLRGHRHNRNVLIRAFPAADLPRGCVAIHLRHLAIHEDQVVGQNAEHLYRLPAIRRQVRADAELFEHARGNLLVHDIVFRHQHPYRHAAEANRQSGAHLFGRMIPPSRIANPQTAEIVDRDGCGVRVCIEFQRQGERKCGAFPELAGHPRWSLP